MGEVLTLICNKQNKLPREDSSDGRGDRPSGAHGALVAPVVGLGVDVRPTRFLGPLGHVVAQGQVAQPVANARHHAHEAYVRDVPRRAPGDERQCREKQREGLVGWTHPDEAQDERNEPREHRDGRAEREGEHADDLTDLAGLHEPVTHPTDPWHHHDLVEPFLRNRIDLRLDDTFHPLGDPVSPAEQPFDGGVEEGEQIERVPGAPRQTSEKHLDFSGPPTKVDGDRVYQKIAILSIENGLSLHQTQCYSYEFFFFKIPAFSNTSRGVSGNG